MTRTAEKWILASASPRRRVILSDLGLRFRVKPSKVPEPPSGEGEAPPDYAVRVARLKARSVSRNLSEGIVIAADTIVVAGNLLLGKPRSRGDAESMLRRLSGRWHAVITGMCLMDSRTKRTRSAFSLSRVHMRRISKKEIEWYLDIGEYGDKAGAYAIQGYASLFVDRIEGCYFNIVGFPVSTFWRLCRRLDIDLLEHSRRA